VSRRPLLAAGVDVQISRGLAFALLDEDASLVDSGWIEVDAHEGAAKRLRSALARASEARRAALHVGIDAPRRPLDAPRERYWERASGAWRARRRGERGYGRHAEVVVSALGLGRPQWTPPASLAPPWMRLGFLLFDGLARAGSVHEVFPSASYRQLAACREPALTLNLGSFHRGPKDMLDACVAALTVRELVAGRGVEVGGADGLGSIVLPRPLGEGVPPALLAGPAGAGGA
jgi:hypothetical protein